MKGDVQKDNKKYVVTNCKKWKSILVGSAINFITIFENQEADHIYA
jgi:hypothetical protein